MKKIYFRYKKDSIYDIWNNKSKQQIYKIFIAINRISNYLLRYQNEKVILGHNTWGLFSWNHNNFYNSNLISLQETILIFNDDYNQVFKNEIQGLIKKYIKTLRYYISWSDTERQKKIMNFKKIIFSNNSNFINKYSKFQKEGIMLTRNYQDDTLSSQKIAFNNYSSEDIAYNFLKNEFRNGAIICIW